MGDREKGADTRQHYILTRRCGDHRLVAVTDPAELSQIANNLLYLRQQSPPSPPPPPSPLPSSEAGSAVRAGMEESVAAGLDNGELPIRADERARRDVE
eukprot:1194536-Prorocentrum_minimum.AAC.2